MECREIKDNASAFYHMEIEEVLRKSIEDHLQFCSDCQKEYELFRNLLGKFQSSSHDQISVSPDYFERLLTKAQGDPEIDIEWRSPSYAPSSIWTYSKVAAIFFIVLSLSFVGKLTWFSPEKQRVLPQTKKPPHSQKEYIRYLSLIDPDDPQGNFKLAQWCKERQLIPQAKKHIEQVIYLEPQNIGAKALLNEFKL